MNPTTIGVVAIAAMLVLLFSGVNIGAAVGIVGLCGLIAIVGPSGAFSMVASVPFNALADYSYAALILFLLMGAFIQNSGMTEKLFDSLSKWLSKIRGGLLMATVLAGGFFGACSGSSIASCALFGRIATPELERKGYHKRLASGIVAVSGTLAALIPPSGLMILYGIATEQSIGKLFMGGIIPGLINIALYVLIIVIVGKVRPNWIPEGTSYTMKERISSLHSVWPIPVIILFIMVAFFFGIATPTEIGGIGAFASLIVALAFVGPKKVQVPKALLQTAKDASMIMITVVGALLFSRLIAVSQLPTELIRWISSMNLSAPVVLLLISVMYVILGTFMGAIEMILITTPVVFPLIGHMGLDPIWWGVVLVQLCEIGCLTPPVGINCYVVKSVVGEGTSLGEIFKGTLLFAISDFILLILMMLFPDIVLFLPNLMAK